MVSRLLRYLILVLGLLIVAFVLGHLIVASFALVLSFVPESSVFLLDPESSVPKNGKSLVILVSRGGERRGGGTVSTNRCGSEALRGRMLKPERCMHLLSALVHLCVYVKKERDRERSDRKRPEEKREKAKTKKRRK